MGFVPLKTERGEAPEAAGAGAGQVSGSGARPTRLVGLNVPVVKPAAGILVAAASSSVRFTPGSGTAVLPPTSDIMTAFCPPGPTSRTSMSPGKVWFTPFSFTVTFKTVPLKPLTAMFEG